MWLFCGPIAPNPAFSLKDAITLLIALSSFVLALSALIHQRKKEKTSDKLTWVRDVLIKPNMGVLEAFYKNVFNIRDQITTADISLEQKENINDYIKGEFYEVRRSFVNLLEAIDPQFNKQIEDHLKELIDDITTVIFDDSYKLTNKDVFEKQIGTRIKNSRTIVYSLLFKYQGT